MNDPSLAEVYGRGGGGWILLLIGALMMWGIGFAWEARQPVPTERINGFVVAVSTIVDRHCSITFQSDNQQQATFRLPARECQQVSAGDRISMWREQYRHDMKGQWKDWVLIPATRSLR